MSESQWNYLGLSHNPFSDPQQEFFPGADRELLLGKVRRLSEWSRPIFAVTGPHGVGKTCLFRALSSSLEAGVVAARVNGSLVSRAGDVLNALVQGYGVAAPNGAGGPLLIELIIAHLKDQSQNDRKSLVLVDDAHLLEQRAVDDLVNLAAAGAHLAFFSEPQFIESLQRAVERNAETLDGGDALLWHEMLLSPFTRDQTSDYLEWRFGEAGYNGRMPFSEHMVDGVQQASDGFPGRLDFAANEQLMLMTVGGARKAAIPRKHLWLAAGLAGGLGLILWLWSPGTTVEVDSQSVSLDLPKAADEGYTPSPGQRDAPASKRLQPEQTESVGGLAPSATGLSTSRASDTRIEVTTPSTSTSRRSTSVPSRSTETVTLSRTVEPVEPKPAIEAPPESRTVRVEPPVTIAPVIESLPAARGDSDAAPAAKSITRAEPRITPSVVSVPEAVDDVFANATNRPRNASWLLAQSDTSFTIQLIGFSDASRAKSYVAKQQQAGRFALFRTRSGERIVHVVSYGVYDSQSAAEAAVASLPATIGKVSPWVRPMASVKGAIKTALQSDG